jgi:hypothetical protein
VVGIEGEICIQSNNALAYGVFPPKINITNHTGYDQLNVGALNSSGTRLAFTRDLGYLNNLGELVHGFTSKLYLMDPDGSNVFALGEGDRSSGGPDWSSDDSRLVYGCRTEDYNDEICIIDADGSNQKNITNHASASDSNPRFVP